MASIISTVEPFKSVRWHRQMVRHTVPMSRPRKATTAPDHVPEADSDDALRAAVAANLRRLRAERGWSLDELGQQAGVSKAMLHQIELGRSQPTVAVAWRIAQGLKVPFNDLLALPTTNHDLVLRRSDAKLLTSGEGNFSSRALFPFDGPARTAEFYELRLKAGAVEAARGHAHGTTEHLVVASGSAVVTVEDVTHQLALGDCLVFRADRDHAYRNEDRTREAVLYLMMTYALPGQVHA